MKNNIRRLSLQTVSLMIIAVAIITVVTSCSKSDNNQETFPGIYYGKLVSGLYTESDTITISVSSSSAVINSRTARGSSYNINATVSGSNLNIPSQSVYVSSLGANYQVTGTGTLNNSTLVIHYAFVSSSDATTNFTFTGTKK